MEAVIARAEEVEPTINAFTDTFFEEALVAADAATDAYAKSTSRPAGRLPLAVKDEPHIEGQRTTEGSLLFADQVASHTDPSPSASSTQAPSCMPAPRRRSSRWPR